MAGCVSKDSYSRLGHVMLTALGHVNNVMYNKYVETARVRFVKHHADDAATEEQRRQWDDLPTPRSLGLILRRITTEFKLVCDYPRN